MNEILPICRQCRKEIKTQQTRCIPCEKIFHPSCHKLHKVYNKANELITCPGKIEIITAKGANNNKGEGSATREHKSSYVEENKTDGHMESKIDWLVKKIKDEMVSKKEIKSIITDIIKEELDEFKKEMEEMRKMIWNTRSDGDAPRSYSEAAKEKKKENVIIIKPKEQQRSEKTKEMIKQNIDIKGMPIGVSKMRKGGNGALILGCESEQELKQLKSTVENKLGNRYQIIEPRSAQMKIKVINVDEEEIKCDKEQIGDMIIKQNNLDEERRGFHMKILKKIIRKQNEGSSSARMKKEDGSLLIEVDNATHEEIIRKKKINVG